MNTTVLVGGATSSIASKFLLENGFRCAPPFTQVTSTPAGLKFKAPNSSSVS